MPMDKLHVLNVARDGTFADSGGFQTKPEDVDAIFKKLSDDDVSHLALYFHGGLVSEKKGLETAERLLPILRDDGDVYPVFVVWESGLFETIGDNLRDIATESFFWRVLEPVSKWLMAKRRSAETGRGVRGSDLPSDEAVRDSLAGPEPLADIDDDEAWMGLSDLTFDEQQEFVAYIQADDALIEEVENIVAGITHDDPDRAALTRSGEPGTSSTVTRMSSDALDELEREYGELEDAGERGVPMWLSKAILQVLGRSVFRLVRGRGHGVHCTIVEEICRQFYLDELGAWVWEGIKDGIEEAFLTNQGHTGLDQHAGTYFFEQLAEYLDGDDVSLRVSLVGHSAGGIYICRALLKAFEVLAEDFEFDVVAMMAPGCDFQLFDDSLLENRERVRAFRLFAMSDAVESEDSIAGPLYSRSLLYLVSGALEPDSDTPVVGLERFYSGQPPYDDDLLTRAGEFVCHTQTDRDVWSVVTGEPVGFNSAAAKHGEFDNDDETLKSVTHMLMESRTTSQ